MKLQPDEEQALRNAGMLIRYAAESPKTLQDVIVNPISDAWKAHEENAWNSDIATKFWIAYSSLCDLIKPVTTDTISNTQPIKKKRWWFSRGYIETTKPRMIAGYYGLVLFILLLSAIVLGFYATVTTTMDNNIKDFIKQGEAAAVESEKTIAAIKLDLQKLDSEKDPLEISLDDKRLGFETTTKITELRAKLMDMWYAADMINERASGIAGITLLISPIRNYDKGDLSRLPNLKDGYETIRKFYVWRRDVSKTQQQVFILNSLYLALVPVVLGAMGACTYVLRAISDEIRDVRFSSTSPVVHSARVILGALAGVVVGLGGIVSSGLGLSSSALAFVAGYAVEPVFAALDGIAEKFKQASKGEAAESRGQP